MNIIKLLLTRWSNHRKQTRFEKAARTLKEFGLTPVRLISKGGVNYSVDANGTHHRIGGKGGK